MTNETKLLTEAEWAGLLGATGYQLHKPELRERGLIAPEPDERVSALVKYFAEIGILITERQAEIAVELVASRMELAKPELTRKMVIAALRAEFPHRSIHEVYGMASRMHAALTEGQSK